MKKTSHPVAAQVCSAHSCSAFNMRHYKCEALLQAIMVEKKDEKAAAGAGGGGIPGGYSPSGMPAGMTM